eukprot:766445-Hanusia_phi.AAC.1
MTFRMKVVMTSGMSLFGLECTTYTLLDIKRNACHLVEGSLGKLVLIQSRNRSAGRPLPRGSFGDESFKLGCKIRRELIKKAKVNSKASSHLLSVGLSLTIYTLRHQK